MTPTYTAPQVGVTRAVLALALAGSCSFFASAQTEATTEETPLAPITVSAHDGVALPYDSTGVSVTVLDVEQLKKQGTTTLSEALTQVPGIYVQAGGGADQLGNASKVTMRGMSKDSYTMTMIDGMRIYNSSDQGNLSSNITAKTTLHNVGQIEVLKGAQAAVYGGGAAGGVLYMATPKGSGEPSYQLFGEAGSFNTYTGSVTAQGEIKKLAYFFNTTYQRTDNKLRTASGQRVTGEKAGQYSNWSGALRLDGQFNEDNALTLTYRYQDAEYYAAGNTNGKPYTVESDLLTAKFNSKINDKISTSLMVGYYQVDNVLGVYSTTGGKYTVDVNNIQIEWQGNYKWNDANTTTAGLAWNREKADVVDSNYSDLNKIYSVFAEHFYTPTENWDNSLAMRLDSSNVFDEKFTFRAASSYKLNKQRTRVFGSLGSSYRSPTAFQRSNGSYSAWGTTYHGNPNLNTEKIYSFDAGVEQHLGENHRVSATYFWTQISDAITTNSPNWSNAYYTNAGHWTIQGVELALRGTFEQKWKTGYTLSYTLTQPKADNDSQIPQTSRQLWSADIHTSPIEQLTVGMGLAGAIGRTDWQPGLRMDNYYSLRAYVRYEVNKHLALHLRVENITNQKYVTDYSWTGMNASIINAGTGIYGGCTVSF